MADQTRDAAITALETALGSVTGVKTVSSELITFDAISETEMPYVLIEELEEAEINRDATSKREISLHVAVHLVYDDKESGTGGGRDMADSMVKVVEAAAANLLGGTVMNISAEPGLPPIQWPPANIRKVRSRRLLLVIQQDFG